MIETHHQFSLAFDLAKEKKAPLNKVPGGGGSSG